MPQRKSTLRRVAGSLFLLALIAGSVAILMGRCNAPMRLAEGNVFGTSYHIKYKSPRELDADITRVLNEVDSSLSLFNKDSRLSAINRGETDKPDEMLEEVLTLALRLAEETNGCFDPTVAPLVNAWGFGNEERKALTDAELDSVMAFVGYRKIGLKHHKIEKADARVTLDFGAIAKGYAVDCIARLMDDEMVLDYMIEIGGEIVVKGHNAEGQPWQIGVQQPDETVGANELATVLELTSGGVATSGNYRNFYLEDGKRIAHTIEPQTGRPVQRDVVSATVVAPTCAEADALATAFMVMGAEKARAFAKAHPKLQVYLIIDKGDSLAFESVK